MVDYKSQYTGDQVDEAVGRVLNNNCIIKYQNIIGNISDNVALQTAFDELENTHLILSQVNNVWVVKKGDETQTFQQVTDLINNDKTYVYLTKDNLILVPVSITATTIQFCTVVDTSTTTVTMGSGGNVSVVTTDLESTVNKVTAIPANPTNAQYPSVKAMVDYVSKNAVNPGDSLDKEGTKINAKTSLLGYESNALDTDTKLFYTTYKRMHSSFNSDALNIVGSVLVTDNGIATGFSGESYIKTSKLDTSKAWKLEFSCYFNPPTDEEDPTTSGLANENDYLWVSDYRRIYFTRQVAIFKLSSADNASGLITNLSILPSAEISTGKTYYIKVEWDGTAYRSYYKLDLDSDYILVSTFTSNKAMLNEGIWAISGYKNSNTYAFNGRTDLKYFSFTNTDSTFTYNKTGVSAEGIKYNVCKDGTRITTIDYIDEVKDLYDEHGYTEYTVIDENNKGVYLPMGAPYGAVQGVCTNRDMSNMSDKGNDKLNTSKAYTTGDVTTDITAYNQLKERYDSVSEESIATEQSPDYTVIGTPTISDLGIASNFTTSSYIRTSPITIGANDELGIKLEYDIPSSVSNTIDLLTPSDGSMTGFYVRVFINSANITLYAYDGTTLGSALIPISDYLGKHIYIDAKASKSKRALHVSLDEVSWTEGINTAAINGWNGGNIAYNISHYSSTSPVIPNSIDLNRIQFYVNGVLKYQPCIIFPYKQSKGGDKIVDVAYRNLVQDVYNRDGYAGYYTIDTVNKNITLPMGDIYGMLNKVSIDDYYKPPLFSMMNSLVKLNDIQWLRADTFSWQDGTLYEVAYNKLVEEFDALPRNTFYRWDGDNGATYYLKKNAGVVTGDAIYAGTPNLNLHNVGTVTVSGSVVKYGNVTLTYITTAGSTVTSIAYEVEGDVAYTRSANDYKICEPSQENNVLNKYNTQGIAMYFILDKANKRFKLPRTKFGFEGLRTSVGDDIEAGLPNITGTFTSGCYLADNKASGAMYSAGRAGDKLDAGGYARGVDNFDASKSNAIYGNSNTVQPPATQTYLYFYVGEYTEDAIKNTAGLNSELFNGKADVDTPSIQAPYIKDTYVNGTSGYRIWSNGYCEQWGRTVYGSPATTVTVTLLKEMKDTNYTCQITLFGNTSAYHQAMGGIHFTCWNLTKTSFQHFRYSAQDIQQMWKVSGYLAEGQY